MKKQHSDDESNQTKPIHETNTTLHVALHLHPPALRQARL